MEQLFSGQKNTKQQGQEMIKTLKDNDENHHHHLMANDLNKTKKFNRQNVHCRVCVRSSYNGLMNVTVVWISLYPGEKKR